MKRTAAPRPLLVKYDKNYERDVCDQVLDELWSVLRNSSLGFEDHGIGHYEYCGATGVHTNIVPVIDLAFDQIVVELPDSDEEFNLGETLSICKSVRNDNGDDAGEVTLMAMRSEDGTNKRPIYNLFQG